MYTKKDLENDWEEIRLLGEDLKAKNIRDGINKEELDQDGLTFSDRQKMIVKARLITKKIETGDQEQLNPMMICPHCQTKGNVMTKSIKQKRGISGSKVMGGLFTGGISLLATGLSGKESKTQAYCASCDSTWTF